MVALCGAVRCGVVGTVHACVRFLILTISLAQKPGGGDKNDRKATLLYVEGNAGSGLLYSTTVNSAAKTSTIFPWTGVSR